MSYWILLALAWAWALWQISKLIYEIILLIWRRP